MIVKKISEEVTYLKKTVETVFEINGKEVRHYQDTEIDNLFDRYDFDSEFDQEDLDKLTDEEKDVLLENENDLLEVGQDGDTKMEIDL